MPGFSVKKPFTILVAVVIIFALGLTSLRSMTPELLPNIELPYVITITTYPGATSEKVETEVTRPLEAGFATLSGLKSISSQSRANASVITMQFIDGVDLDTVSIDILQSVDRTRGGWDELVSTPIIVKMNPNMLPVMIAAVEQEGSGTADLSRFMDETLQLRLEGIDGVASLEVSGMRREQVNVVVRSEKVAAFNARVSAAIEKELNEKEGELADTKADLKDKLEDLKSKNSELENGARQLAGGIGDGATKIAEGWAALDALPGKLEALKANLGAVQAQEDALVAQGVALAVSQALAQAQADWEAANAGVPFPDAQAQQVTDATITAMTPVIKAQVAAQTGPIKAQIQGGITQIETALGSAETTKKQLAQAQGALESGSISAQLQLSTAAAQLAAGQAQIQGGITQIESGLEQLEDAREAALEQADMSAMLTMSMIQTMLKAQNFSMPAGMVTQDNTDYLVRVGDETTSLQELQELVLFDPGLDDIPALRLSEVADVFMSDNLSDVYAKINGHDGILLMFNKQSESSTTAVTDAILEKFSELSKQFPGLVFTPLMNQGEYIYTVTNSITSDLLWGALFAVIILLLFLRDIRPTFITLCSIPISLVFALVAMYFSGVTINIISLSGLAIAVGRLVDDSVVVIENIFRLRAKGYSPVRAAISGAGQVAGAVAASTLTTICVFLPIVFVQGLTRQLFSDFALTFAFALLASLLIALTLVPAMASGMFRRMEPKEHRFMDRLNAVYDRMLVWSLRFKPVVVILVVVMLAGSAFAVMTKGFAYMPNGNMGQLSISMTMPKDSPLEERRALADEAGVRISQIEGVETVGQMSGGSQMSGLSFLTGGLGGGSGLGSVTAYVLLDTSADMDRITETIQQELDELGVEADVSASSGMDASSLGGSGISIEIFGDAVEDLMASAELVSETLRGVAGVAEVDDGLEDATVELHFTVDRAEAAGYGLTTAQVFQQVNAALTKESTATQVVWKGDSYNVVVANEYAEEDALTPDYIKNLTFSVTKRDGTIEQVRLADIASVSEARALPTLMRSDQRRYLPVSVTTEEDSNITLVTQSVEKALAGIKLPDGVRYEVSGENATIMEAFSQLGLMLILGLLLVYLIMVAQFQSLKSPFIIMFTIPLAFTGGFLALLLTDNILSVISLIGFAMLVGIIVSNAIVLVDYINRLRLDGAERVAAIREGAATRMRPILMTALATIFALLIMALGIGDGSEMMQPLAIVCIGGLAYGTLMTLFVIPIIYDIFNKKELRKLDDEDLIIDFDA